MTLLGFTAVASAAPAPADRGISKNAPSKNTGNPKSLELNEKGTAAAQAGDFAKAEELLRQATNIDPNNITAVFNLSGVYLRNKKEQQAIQLLLDYTKKVPNDAGLFARLGDAYFATKQIELAASQYEKSLKLNPAYPHSAARLGTIYTMLNKLDGAEKMFLKAVEQNPSDAQLLANLGSVFLANSKPERAVSTAKRGLQIKPSSSLYVTLGSAYEMLKEFDSSLIAFERARDLGDKSEDLQKKIEHLNKINS